LDNRFIGKNGILVIDRQVVYPGERKARIDLLGLRRLESDRDFFTFVVIELKNKNNVEIGSVCSQTTRYIDLICRDEQTYERFRVTYEKVIYQKKKLGLLKNICCPIAPWEKIKQKNVLGLIVLDNFNIKGDLVENGLLARAIKNWNEAGDDYDLKLFLKTNVFDSTFFINRVQAETLLKEYKERNLPCASVIQQMQ